MYRLAFFFLFAATVAQGQVNIIRNGSFSTPGQYWVSTGDFNYGGSGSSFNYPCSSPSYAYTAATSGANIDNATGTLSQETITIPSTATGGTLRFKNRTGTTVTTHIIDHLKVYIEYGSTSVLVKSMTNLDYSPGSCSQVTVDVSTHINTRKGQKFTLKFVSTQLTDGEKTIFRVDDVSIDVTAASSCSESLSPGSVTLPATAGGGSFNINVNPNTCSWSATTPKSWIHISAPASGTGDAALSFTVDANVGTSRVGTIQVGDETVTISQAGLIACNTSITPNLVNVGPAATAANLNVTITPATCSWAAASSATWLTINSATSGSGNAVINYSVQTNTGGPRSETINVNGQVFTVNQAGVGVPPVITITSAEVAPWQRERDDLPVNISANYTGMPVNGVIQLDVYINGIYAGTPLQATSTSAGGTHVFKYGISYNSLNPKPRQGDEVGYQLIHNESAAYADVGTKTKIIEKKWVAKNVVYWRDSSSADILRIPVRWDKNNMPISVRIRRYNTTSLLMPGSSITGGGSVLEYFGYPLSPINNYPITLRHSSGQNVFPVNQNEGYCEIKAANSNIYANEFLPGDFYYEILSSGGLIETGKFDVTKIGKIKGDATSKKLIVVVGGFLNETESTAEELRAGNATGSASTLSFSVVEYLRNIPGFSTWYVAQGNANTVKRNGYDIGVGIQRILKLNNITSSSSDAKVVIVSHSKGGLDVKSMILGRTGGYNYNESFDNTVFNFHDSLIRDVLKQVIFLGTPHKGSSLENILSFFPFTAASSPGASDLKKNSFITKEMNANVLDDNIKYCNVTGFKLSNNSHSQGGVEYPIVTGGDGVVPEWSSLALNAGAKVQLRQLKGGHASIHKNLELGYYPVLNSLHAAFMCGNGETNLQKIKRFVESSNIIGITCNSPYAITNFFVSTMKSKLSNAWVHLKKVSGETYLLGRTGTDGRMNLSSFLPIAFADSLLISSPGVETISFPYSNYAFTDNSIKVAMFKSSIASNKIMYPRFQLQAEPISSLPNVQVTVKGNNVSEFLVNKNNSDTLFEPLSVTNGSAFISLDSGYNRKLVKMVGIDTVVMEKIIYYLPDSFFTQYTKTVFVNVDVKYAGVGVYVNDVLYKELAAGIQPVTLFADQDEIRFSRIGYIDTVITLDSSAAVVLNMVARNYSSPTDSSVFDFTSRFNPQYWKSISVQSPNKSGPISVKQVDDPFTGRSLIPQTRKFLFRNLSATTSNLRTAIVLDQPLTPEPDSIYLLRLSSGGFTKYRANTPGISVYDPEVQKLAFDLLQLGAKEMQELILMKKQAAVPQSPSIVIYEGQRLSFPLSLFVSDPDSLRGDITAISANPYISFSPGMVNILGPFGAKGGITVPLSYTHDFITTRASYFIKVLQSPLQPPNAFSPNKDGINDFWSIANLERFPKCLVEVFDRWGKKVFHSNAYPKPWDGSYNGKPLPAGVYYYIIHPNEKGYQKLSGYITLLR